MKLIDADELRKTLFIYAPVSAQNVIGFCVEHAPTIEVVKCKNCKYRSSFKVGNLYPCQFGGYITEDDFCSRGEQKKGGSTS